MLVIILKNVFWVKGLSIYYLLFIIYYLLIIK